MLSYSRSHLYRRQKFGIFILQRYAAPSHSLLAPFPEYSIAPRLFLRACFSLMAFTLRHLRL